MVIHGRVCRLRCTLPLQQHMLLVLTVFCCFVSICDPAFFCRCIYILYAELGSGVLWFLSACLPIMSLPVTAGCTVSVCVCVCLHFKASFEISGWTSNLKKEALLQQTAKNISQDVHSQHQHSDAAHFVLKSPLPKSRDDLEMTCQSPLWQRAVRVFYSLPFLVLARITRLANAAVKRQEKS